MLKKNFSPPVNYCRAIVIVHGKSERLMVEYIKRKLRLNIAIISNCKGKSSIQVSGLLKFISSSTQLKSLNAVKKEFMPQVEKGKLVGCKIFTIMDLDDCSITEVQRYISGEMFDRSWYKDYIVPIWFLPNFDEAMKTTKLVDKVPGDKEKGKVYSNLFQKEIAGLKEFPVFKEKMKKCKETNIEEFLEYCVNVVEKNKK